MLWSGPARERLLNASAVSATTLVVGLFAFLTPLRDPLADLGYDLLFFQTPDDRAPARAPARGAEVVIIRMGEGSRDNISDADSQALRRQCTQLLRHLQEAGCRLVVLDFLFEKSREVDQEFAAAIEKIGCVLLAEDSSDENKQVHPTSLLKKFARACGDVAVQRDGVRFQSEKFHTNGLPRVAATLWNELTHQPPAAWPETLWLQYYGRESPLQSLDFSAALNAPLNCFSNKVVFVGAESSDFCRTPYSRWGGSDYPGVDILATAFLNLIGNEGFVPLSYGKWLGLLLVTSLIFGCAMSLVRPFVGAVLAVLLGLGFGELALEYIAGSHIWFPWLTILAVQLPCAWVCSAWRYRRLTPERLSTLLAPALASASRSKPAELAVPASEEATLPEPVHVIPAGPPVVPDHALLRCVGRGGYGEVWMARNTIGLFEAVKVAYRDRFKDPEPYEREFKGIQKYMPISLNHLGLIHVLQVGRNDAHGYFYYVMELGDDEHSGQQFDPLTYSPRDLAKEIKAHGRFSLAQCLEWFIPLADALSYLHRQKLIHRDIKPSNIIFIRGVPKLADIGLVTEMSGAGDVSYAGTEGYIPPEGPGDPAADIFALGRVIYEASTAQDRRAYPSLPTNVSGEEEMKQILQLMPIITKACHPNPLARYTSVDDLHADLLRLRGKRTLNAERRTLNAER